MRWGEPIQQPQCGAPGVFCQRCAAQHALLDLWMASHQQFELLRLFQFGLFLRHRPTPPNASDGLVRGAGGFCACGRRRVRGGRPLVPAPAAAGGVCAIGTRAVATHDCDNVVGARYGGPLLRPAMLRSVRVMRAGPFGGETKISVEERRNYVLCRIDGA